MFPIKFILILQPNFKAVLRLDIIPIADNLRLNFSIHQFNGVVTDSIIQSFSSNSSNKQFFKALPIEKIFEDSISQNEAEYLFMNLKNFIDGSPIQNKLYNVQLASAKLYLDPVQIFSLNTFIYQFVSNYEMMKLNLAVIQVKENQQQEQIQERQPILNNIQQLIPTPHVQREEHEELEKLGDPNNIDEIVLLSDILKLCPNESCMYYISKYISNMMTNGKYEKVIIADRNNNAIISIAPLLDYQSCIISNFHHNLLNIINSFKFTNDEYISKLRSLVRELIYIVGKENPKEFFIHLKTIGFLIYIYSNKLTNNSFANQIDLNGKIKVSLFFDLMTYMINYSIDYIIKGHIDRDQISFNSIIFDHLKIVEYEEDFSVQELKQVINKELYLIDIDRDYFINRVFSMVNKDKEVKTKQYDLILNNPSTFDIKFILEQPPTNSLLSYQIIVPEQKQFESNKIITPEYLQILQLINTPTISKSILKNINIIVSKYADNIINVIFKELSMVDSTSVTSLLNVLNTYIRPYLGENSTVEVEMFILYRLVIPYLYDIYGITNFIDYFH